MKFNTYSKTDTYYEFLGDNGLKVLCPINSVILVDDGATISVKTVGSRKTIGYIVK